MSQFMLMEGRENAFSVSKLDEEHLKDTRSRQASSVVCARSCSAENVTMNTTHKHCLLFLLYEQTIEFNKSIVSQFYLKHYSIL